MALFDSTFYILADDQMLCVGTESLSRGPLNVVTTAPSTTNWTASGVQHHAAALVSASEIRLPNRFVFSMSQRLIWSPGTVIGDIDPVGLRRGLDALYLAAAHSAPNDGIGRFLIRDFAPACTDFVCRAAQAPVTEARSWLSDAFAIADMRTSFHPAWVGEIAGLGPGLTPSGDDFLGGMMIALHTLGRADICADLWRVISQHAKTTGNAVSFAHSAAASEGVGGEGMHAAIAAIVGGNNREFLDAIPAIARIGHTSGWDALVGVATTFESWLAARPAASP